MPKNIKNIQKFLGFGNFNRRFIINYSIIAILFTEFTKKNILFIWITVQQEIFNKFKKIFISILYLAIFKSEKLIKIKIDISNKGVGIYIL